jgi:hypothetical protein
MGKWLASPRGGRCWLPHQGSEVVAYSRSWNVSVFKVSPGSPVACPNTKKVPWWVLKGKVMVSPRSGPWLFLAPKVLQLWTNHLEWFMEGPCEWVSLSTLPSPIPELQPAPLPLKGLWARERAPNPPYSAAFYWAHIWAPWGVGGASLIIKFFIN